MKHLKLYEDKEEIEIPKVWNEQDVFNVHVLKNVIEDKGMQTTDISVIIPWLDEVKQKLTDYGTNNIPQIPPLPRRADQSYNNQTPVNPTPIRTQIRNPEQY